jgi:hypothetical protein
VTQSGPTIVVTVADADPAGKERRQAHEAESPDKESGRGLFLVSSIASAWDTHRRESGLVVWAEVRETESHGA